MKKYLLFKLYLVSLYSFQQNHDENKFIYIQRLLHQFSVIFISFSESVVAHSSSDIFLSSFHDVSDLSTSLSSATPETSESEEPVLSESICSEFSLSHLDFTQGRFIASMISSVFDFSDVLFDFLSQETWHGSLWLFNLYLSFSISSFSLLECLFENLWLLER